jgi:hypothetical protein
MQAIDEGSDATNCRGRLGPDIEQDGNYFGTLSPPRLKRTPSNGPSAALERLCQWPAARLRRMSAFDDDRRWGPCPFRAMVLNWVCTESAGRLI